MMSKDERSRILIIDDDEVVLITTSALLQAMGYAVTTHHGPFGASAVIETTRPHLVLLDMNMPGLSGPAFAKLIRAESWSDQVRIFYFSSSDEELMRNTAQKTGVDGYIRKGDRAALRAKVAEALAG